MQSQLAFESITEKMDLPVLQKNTDNRLSAIWAAASGDFDPIHYDDVYARKQKLPTTIVNGRLKMALLANWLFSFIGPVGRLKRVSARHQGMDLIGKTMTLKGCVARKYTNSGEQLVDCDIWIEDPEGNKTATGSATFSLFT